MKKLLLLFLVLLFPIVSFSAIDECKTDIYYANGITTKDTDAQYVAERILEPTILKEKFNDDEVEMKKHIGEIGYSYNQTNGFFYDGMETYLQKLDIQIYVDLWLRLKGYISTHLEDVEEHIKKYSNRIKLGHKVLVIAHSQGNLFTNEIYKALGKRSENAWMQNYFGAVSVASPMKADIKDDTVRITWDNDGVGRLIAHNGSVDPDEVTNPIRSVEWKHSFDYNSFDATAEIIPTPYAKQTQIGKIIRVGSPQFVNYNKYKAIENGLDLGFNVHAFTYYMGKPLTRDVEIDIPLVPFADGTIVKKEFKDPFDKNKTLQTNEAKNLIVSAIKEQLNLLDKVDSQWIRDQKFEKNTCNYKITLKHQYDPSIEMAEKVYPFNQSKKLYQVNGEWVKASCGGTHILDQWDGKKDNECWMIDNVEKEKIKQEYYYKEFTEIGIAEIRCHVYESEQSYNIAPLSTLFFDYFSYKSYSTKLILKTKEERLKNAKKLMSLAENQAILMAKEAVVRFVKDNNRYKKIEFEIIFSEPNCAIYDYLGLVYCFSPYNEIKYKVWMK